MPHNCGCYVMNEIKLYEIQAKRVSGAGCCKVELAKTFLEQDGDEFDDSICDQPKSNTSRQSNAAFRSKSGQNQSGLLRRRRPWLLTPDFNAAHITFLGDYCDRGPNTREVIDFLVGLPSRYPDQKHVFHAGNHDLVPDCEGSILDAGPTFESHGVPHGSAGSR
ncbi:Tyrosine-protein phosphatase RLPH2, partial [Cucurbita argyrosperma subsp. sororia]